MKTRALVMGGFLAAGMACLPWQDCVAQDLWRGGLRLNDPNLFRPYIFPSVLNSQAFSSGIHFDWTMPVSDLPAVAAPPRPSARVAPMSAINDRLPDWSPKLDYAYAEVGFMYGRSTGKYGGDYKDAYILGEVGDNNFHISAGAAYQDSSFRFPRGGR